MPPATHDREPVRPPRSARRAVTRWAPCAALLLMLSCGGSSGGQGQPLRVDVLFVPGGIGDRSYCDDVYAGLVRAGLETDLTLALQAPADAAAAAATFDAWSSAPTLGPELIISMVGLPGAAADCAFGGRRVVELDGRSGPCPGLTSIAYRAFAPAFLAGVAAVAVSPRKTVSVIGGMETPAVSAIIRGFVAGVAHAGGTVLSTEYLSATEDGFSNPELARTVAERRYADADVVFPVAGGSGAGVFEAAKVAPGRFTFGMDVDQTWLGRGVIVGSVVKRLDLSVEQVIREAAAGRLLDGAASVGLAEGFTDLVVNDLFSDRVAAAVAAARAQATEAERLDLLGRPP
jgi:basic membrane protein A